jgi:hypothetical protein
MLAQMAEKAPGFTLADAASCVVVGRRVLNHLWASNISNITYTVSVLLASQRPLTTCRYFLVMRAAVIVGADEATVSMTVI